MDSAANKPATDADRPLPDTGEAEAAQPASEPAAEAPAEPSPPVETEKESEPAEHPDSARLRAVRPAEADQADRGRLTFDPSIVIEIAQHEARALEEVIDLSGGFIDGWMKGRSRGIRVEELEDSYSIRLNLVVKYGTNCPELFKQLRERIGTQIKQMTGREVSTINIHIAGVKESPGDESHDELDPPIGEDVGINF